jgi:hypothetical protein
MISTLWLLQPVRLVLLVVLTKLLAVLVGVLLQLVQ